MLQTVILNTKKAMPIIGLGTYHIGGDELVHTILEAALKTGYRSIDTASSYRNEASIGQSLKKLMPGLGLQRADIFITSKLAPKDQGAESCRAACLKSLTLLDTDYLDLFLIHWPGTHGLKPEDARHPGSRAQSWLAMEQLYREGTLKAIGVSNYNIKHMEELLATCSVKPAVLQSEFHPHLVQTELMEFCRSHDIHFQAYSSLGSSKHCQQLLLAPPVVEIANRHRKSSAHVLLRWAVQQGVGVLPKTTKPERVIENFDIANFTLTEDEMSQISALDKQEHYCWNPDSIT